MVDVKLLDYIAQQGADNQKLKQENDELKEKIKNLETIRDHYGKLLKEKGEVIENMSYLYNYLHEEYIELSFKKGDD